MRRTLLVIAPIVVIVGIVLLAGCSQQTAPSAPAPSTSSAPKADAPAAPKAAAPAAAPKAEAPAAPKTAAPAAAPKAAAPAAAQDGPKRGQTLRISVLSGAPSYDSHTDTTMRIHAHSAAVFNGLVRTDQTKSDVSPENMVPDLAEKWEVSPDRLTYTFTLRRGVKFHDGKPFTSKDVKYSLDKFRDPKRSAFAGNVEAIEAIDVVDDYTVKMRLKYVSPDILMLLAPPYAAIFPEHLKAVDPKKTDFLVGTGPFKFKQLVPGKVSTYERNPDYFMPGLPYLDKYEVYYMKIEAIMDAFISGQLDTAGTLRELFELDKSLSEKVMKLAPETKYNFKVNGSTRGIFFNLAKDFPWKDVRVRRAMAQVVDYDQAIVAAVGGKDQGFEANAGLVPYYAPEALPRAEVAKLMGVDKPMAERITTAKQLMSSAGYANGFKAEMIMRSGEPQIENASLYIMDQWKKNLNIDVKLTPLDRTIAYPRRDKGDFELVADSIATTTGTVLNEFLSPMLSGEMRNFGKWSNAEYDNLSRQALREPDKNKRIELAQKAHRIFLEEMPYLIFHGSAYASAWRPDLRTGWPNPVNGIVVQPVKTSYPSIDRIWFAETSDAAKWVKR